MIVLRLSHEARQRFVEKTPKITLHKPLTHLTSNKSEKMVMQIFAGFLWPFRCWRLSPSNTLFNINLIYRKKWYVMKEGLNSDLQSLQKVVNEVKNWIPTQKRLSKSLFSVHVVWRSSNKRLRNNNICQVNIFPFDAPQRFKCPYSCP